MGFLAFAAMLALGWGVSGNPFVGVFLGAAAAWAVSFIRKLTKQPQKREVEVKMRFEARDDVPADGTGYGPSKRRERPTQPKVDPYDVPELMRLGRWDEARQALQKMAYNMPRDSQATKDQFAALMVLFAKEDPLYATACAEVQRLVTLTPGIKQTALYPELKPLTVEEARYVLYFAEEMGHVRRVKKGNSYLVYPPDLPLAIKP